MPAIRPISSSYRKLVSKFPLRAIRSDDELAAALTMVESLLTAELDEDEKDYLDTLTDIIVKYEHKTHPIPDASEAEVLQFLMESKRLNQRELEKKVGIAQPTLSAVLNGTRTLTKTQVIKLAKFFAVSPAVFLPRG